MNRQLVSMILAKGKALAPDRFPAIQEGADGQLLLDSWVESLSIVALPEQVWSAAVTMWATSMVGDRMATPRDMIAAAFAVRDRWENDPRRRELLEEHRAARLNANYRSMGLETVERQMLDRPDADTVATAADAAPGMGQLGELLEVRRRNM